MVLCDFSQTRARTNGVESVVPAVLKDLLIGELQEQLNIAQSKLQETETELTETQTQLEKARLELAAERKHRGQTARAVDEMQTMLSVLQAAALNAKAMTAFFLELRVNRALGGFIGVAGE